RPPLRGRALAARRRPQSGPGAAVDAVTPRPRTTLDTSTGYDDGAPGGRRGGDARRRIPASRGTRWREPGLHQRYRLRPSRGCAPGEEVRCSSFTIRRRQRPQTLKADGQMSASTHPPQSGLRAVHTARPCRISRRLSFPRSSARTSGLRAISILTGSVSVVSPSRRDRRWTWVSTGRPGSPMATLRTTFAVLGPPAGRG